MLPVKRVEDPMRKLACQLMSYVCAVWATNSPKEGIAETPADEDPYVASLLRKLRGIEEASPGEEEHAGGC